MFTRYELGESAAPRVHAFAARVDQLSLGFAVAKAVFLPNAVGLGGFGRKRGVGGERKNDLLGRQRVAFGFINGNLVCELR